MIRNDTFVVSITKDTVIAFRVEKKNGSQVVTESVRVLWQTDALAAAFDQVADTIGVSSIRCVISDELAYTVSLSNVSETLTHEEAQELLQSHIPETLRRTYWDYSLEKHTDTTVLQAYVFTQQFSDEMRRAVDLSRVNIEVIEPVSQSLTRQIIGEYETCVVFHSDADTRLGFVVQNKNIVSVFTFPEEETVSERKKYLAYACETFALEQPTVICSGIEIAEFEAEKVRVIPVVLHPAVGILQKKQTTGSSKKHLNVAIGVQTARSPGPEYTKGHGFFEKKHVVYGFVTVFAILGVTSGVSLVRFYAGNKTDQSIQESPLVEIDTAVQIPRYSDYRVAVDAQVAFSADLTEALRKKGFETSLITEQSEGEEASSSANAALELEIRSAPEVPQKVLDAIDAELDDYDPSNEYLTPGSGYDVLITVKEK